MKKSKLKIALVTSFIASMALSACSASVTKDDTNLVDFTAYDGETSLAIAIDDIYNEYMKSSSGIAKYYDQVLEVLIRNAFQKDKTGTGSFFGDADVKLKKNYNKILSEAKDSVKGQKETAKENAETNGTDYATEWKAILSEKGVENEEELLQYFIYKLEKEEIEDWYFDNHEDEIKEEWLGVASDGSSTKKEVSSRFPYHIRHILIKVEDGASDYVRGTISADQAKLLSSTVQLLAQGTLTFGEVAKMKSEDSSSSSYGDVGIMTNAISSGKLGMVNEFQLGIYAYDAIDYNAENSVIEEGLGLDREIEVDGATSTVRDYFGSTREINELPYSLFVELGDVAELETNYGTGLPVEDGKSAIYPRNLLWNRYLNNHGIFIITNSERASTADITDDTDVEAVDSNTNSYLTTETLALADGTTQTIDYTESGGLIGFNNSNVKASSNRLSGTNKKILTDEAGNVIIGVRSEYGIHLMIVQKSIFEFDQTEPTLEQYYTTAVPGSSEWKKEGLTDDSTTYVNFINTVKQSEYNTRAETVRSAIKGFDSTYDYRLYEDLVEVSNIDTSNENTATILNLINNYIDIQREKNENAQEEGLEDVWQTYVELLEVQDFYRHDLDRIIPEGCKIAFTSDLTDAQKAEYEEGGRCYVK